MFYEMKCTWQSHIVSHYIFYDVQSRGVSLSLLSLRLHLWLYYQIAFENTICIIYKISCAYLTLPMQITASLQSHN